MTTFESIRKMECYLKDRKFSESTIGQYRSIVKTFLSKINQSPENITSDMIDGYLRQIKNARTRNQTIGCLKTFFRYGCGMPKKVKAHYSKVPKSLPKTISKEKFEIDLEKCKNLKHRLIFCFLFYHGMRGGEVIRCKIGWFGGQVIEGRKHYTLKIKGKGAKDRLIVLSNFTVNVLIHYADRYKINLHDKDQFLFEGQFTNQYSAGSIRQLTKRYFGINPHGLRHSSATELVNQNVNFRKIQLFLGHGNLKTTELYTHTSANAMVGVHP